MGVRYAHCWYAHTQEWYTNIWYQAYFIGTHNEKPVNSALQISWEIQEMFIIEIWFLMVWNFWSFIHISCALLRLRRTLYIKIKYLQSIELIYYKKVVSHNTHITGYQYLHFIRLFGYFMFTAISIPSLLAMKSVRLKLEAWNFLNVIHVQMLLRIIFKLIHSLIDFFSYFHQF